MKFQLIGLIISIIISLFSISLYEVSGSFDKLLNLWIIIPGIVFSLYVLVLQINKKDFDELIIELILLLIVYIISYILGIVTFGIAVPIVGGYGACQINYLLNGKFSIRFFIIGFVSALVGLGLFILFKSNFLFHSDLNEGFSYGLIIFTWQFAVGFEYIKRLN